MVKRQIMGMALTVAAALPLMGAKPPELTFEMTVKAGKLSVFAQGGADEKQSGNVTVKNIGGREAAVFAKPGDYLTFPAKNNLDAGRGTLNLWVYEIDTAPDRRIWNPYFQWRNAEGVFYFLRLWQPLDFGGGVWYNGQRQSWCGAANIAAGKWTMLTLTYRNNILCLYVDGAEVGKKVGAEFVFTPDAASENFQIGRFVAPASPGDDTFFTGRHLLTDAPDTAKQMKIGTEEYGAYAISDFAVFSKPLSAAAVEALYQGGVEALAQWDDELELTAKTQLGTDTIAVRLDSCKVMPGDTAELRLIDADGKTVAEAPQLTAGADGFAPAEIALAGVPVGDYTLEAAVQGQGTQAGRIAVPYQKMPPFEWMNNTLGAADVVLPGFEALRVNGDTVKVWGRDYVFGDSLLPRQIINQGFDILAKPIAISGQVGNAVCELHFREVKLVSASATRAVYEGKGTFGELSVTGTVTVEYDGLMDFALTFSPPSGKEVTVQQLKMDIPLVKTEAALFHHSQGIGALWPENWRSPVTPLGIKSMILMGNPDRCLQWLLESDQYFFPEDNPNTLQTSENAAARTFTVEVIGAADVIKEPFTLKWMLEAGPVKARPPHWRGWTRRGRRYIDPELHSAMNYNYDWWARGGGEPIPKDGFPAEPDRNLFKDGIPNVSMHFASDRPTWEKEDRGRRSLEWQIFGDEWKRMPEDVQGDNMPGWREVSLDTASQSWGDWHIWGVNELFRTTGVRGLYYDDWLPGQSTNALAGSGYIGRNGVRRATRDIRNHREFHRRVYALVRQYRPDDGVIYLHTSGCPLLPVLAFADIDYDGEILSAVHRRPAEGNYFDTYTMDLFQMLFSARQFGVVPGFHDVTTKVVLGYDGPVQMLLAEKQRQLAALLMLHDIQMHSAFTTGHEEARFVWLDHFGIAEDDVEFYGYWDTDPAAELLDFTFVEYKTPDAASKGYVSVYTRPGKALLIIARDAPNNYAGASLARIKLNRSKLGFKANSKIRATDMESCGRNPLGMVTGDMLSDVPVECDNYVAVLLEEIED